MTHIHQAAYWRLNYYALTSSSSYTHLSLTGSYNILSILLFLCFCLHLISSFEQLLFYLCVSSFDHTGPSQILLTDGQWLIVFSPARHSFLATVMMRNHCLSGDSGPTVKPGFWLYLTRDTYWLPYWPCNQMTGNLTYLYFYWPYPNWALSRNSCLNWYFLIYLGAFLRPHFQSSNSARASKF